MATMMQKYPHDVVRFKQITGRVERYIHQFCNSMRLIRCKSCLLQRRRLALLIGVGLFVQRQVIQGFGVSLLDIEVELEHRCFESYNFVVVLYTQFSIGMLSQQELHPAHSLPVCLDTRAFLLARTAHAATSCQETYEMRHVRARCSSSTVDNVPLGR